MVCRLHDMKRTKQFIEQRLDDLAERLGDLERKFAMVAALEAKECRLRRHIIHLELRAAYLEKIRPRRPKKRKK